MKWISTIKAIGPNAISEKDRVVILFGQTAKDELQDVSVIQAFDDEQAAQAVVLKKGDTVTIDGTTFLINYVGPMAVSNLRALQHASLFFTDKVPKKPMSNALYWICQKTRKCRSSESTTKSFTNTCRLD